jgi:hypothetical protein
VIALQLNLSRGHDRADEDGQQRDEERVEHRAKSADDDHGKIVDRDVEPNCS